MIITFLFSSIVRFWVTYVSANKYLLNLQAFGKCIVKVYKYLIVNPIHKIPLLGQHNCVEFSPRFQ